MGRIVLRKPENKLTVGASTYLGKPCTAVTHTHTLLYTYVVSLMTMRLGGMAARKRPIGRKAASALRKSLKVSLPLDREKATMRRSVRLRFFIQCN